MKFRICPNPDCGASLDHGEICDCKKKKTVPVAREQPQEKPMPDKRSSSYSL